MSDSKELPLLQIRENFTALETVINSILFARIIEGTRGAEQAVDANKQTLNDAREWLPGFFRQQVVGWLLQQKAFNYGKKGEKILLSMLTPMEVAQHVDAVSNSTEVEEHLHVTQFVALLTLGMLYNLKSTNYAQLNRVKNLGGDSDIAKEKSFWMFNWQPETVFRKFKKIKSTGSWVLETPVDLAVNYPYQLLEFGHFVSALLVASEERSTELRRSFTRKETQNQTTQPSGQTILLPSGMAFKKSEEPKKDVTDSSNYDGTIPDVFSDFIKGL